MGATHWRCDLGPLGLRNLTSKWGGGPHVSGWRAATATGQTPLASRSLCSASCLDPALPGAAALCGSRRPSLGADSFIPLLTDASAVPKVCSSEERCRAVLVCVSQRGPGCPVPWPRTTSPLSSSLLRATPSPGASPATGLLPCSRGPASQPAGDWAERLSFPGLQNHCR